jgi:hypothetical protein
MMMFKIFFMFLVLSSFSLTSVHAGNGTSMMAAREDADYDKLLFQTVRFGKKQKFKFARECLDGKKSGFSAKVQDRVAETLFKSIDDPAALCNRAWMILNRRAEQQLTAKLRCREAAILFIKSDTQAARGILVEMINNRLIADEEVDRLDELENKELSIASETE